jgi:hypothetical protein
MNSRKYATVRVSKAEREDVAVVKIVQSLFQISCMIPATSVSLKREYIVSENRWSFTLTAQAIE